MLSNRHDAKPRPWAGLLDEAVQDDAVPKTICAGHQLENIGACFSGAARLFLKECQTWRSSEIVKRTDATDFQLAGAFPNGP